MILGFVCFELLIAFLSAYLAWHFMLPTFMELGTALFFFIAFNSLFVLMRLTHAVFKGSRELVIFFSFLLAIAVYATLFFIINDLLLVWQVYGQMYFTYQRVILGLLTVIFILTALYAVWNTKNIVVKVYKINTRKHVRARIAFISDLHIAPNNMSAARLQTILSELTQIRPDFVVLGGDIIEMRPDYFMERTIAGLFQHFAQKTPLLAVVGNHEYYGGQLAENIDALKQAGIIVLKDNAHLFAKDNIAFIGRDDRTNRHRMPLERLLTSVPDSMYKIIIDHDPADLTESTTLPIDLQLSGHTHNGQIFPFNLLVKFIFMNAYGHRVINGVDTIVSSGIGTWGPLVRVGTRSEIVVVDIAP